MGWMTELSTVYDAVMQNSEKDDKPLPLYHIENNAPLIITIDGKGNFRSARLLSKKENQQTIMPCTEDSAARTGNTDPYPFCDKLEYVALDFGNYVKGKKLEEKHTKYLDLLRDWAESKYATKKLESVYSYVKKGTVVADILKVRIPEITNITDIDKNNVFVKWEVEIPEDAHPQTWNETEIQQSWIQYYVNCYLKERGFCYTSGAENILLSRVHPKKIRHSGDSARIVSSNDGENYTFRGRFETANQACQIGIEVTNKAHNTLRWLIARQGTTIGNGLTIVSWCSVPEVQPNILCNTPGLDDDTDDIPYSTAQEFAKALNHRLHGYYGKINNADKIMVMVINAATPGRMSILLYREFAKSDFCETLEFWHTHLAWFYTYWANKKGEKPHAVHTIGAPSPEEIAKTAYGAHLNDNVNTMAIQRILPCILDKSPMPKDIEQLCFSRASNLFTVDEGMREKTLETACAVIKYNYFVRNQEDYMVGVDEGKQTRDILFGKLLAIAEKVESQVLYARGEHRETNAMRYMQRFSKFPSSTWKLLYVDKLPPYLAQLKYKSRGWYEGLIREIETQIAPDEFVDKPLLPEFLLGYHGQLKKLWEKTDKNDTDTQED
jgi:CRISPR-associated protein Csd1